MKGVTHRGYAVESLVRWNKPICPLVAGIPAEQGEFVLQRISQAARDAGAELAGEKCKPNFHVVLTPEPEQLLDLWRKRAPKLYGMTPPAQVRRILGKPRPVRAWYNVWDACGQGVDTGTIIGGDTNFGLAAGTPYGTGCLKDSRLTFSVVQSISSVIVLVDLDDTKEIKLGPLTDYISMLGLTDVDLDGDWGDEPTILRLFAARDATCAAAEHLGSCVPEGAVPDVADGSPPAHRDRASDGERLHGSIASCRSRRFISDRSPSCTAGAEAHQLSGVLRRQRARRCRAAVLHAHGSVPDSPVLHTYVGATIAGLIFVLLFALVRRFAMPLLRILRLEDLSVRAVALGAFAGTYSHVLLDSLMHPDMRPFAPFSDANPLLGAISLRALHGFCLVAGVVGLAIIFARRLRSARPSRARVPYLVEQLGAARA